MKLKKLLALTLTGAVLTASLTACTPLDAAEIVYDSIFGGGSSSTGSGNNGNTGNSGNTGNNGPKTGDKGAALWFALAGLCGCGLVAMAVTPRYKGKRVA